MIKPPLKKTQTITIRISEEERQAFKKACLLKGESMSQAITAFVREYSNYINNDEPPQTYLERNNINEYKDPYEL